MGNIPDYAKTGQIFPLKTFVMQYAYSGTVIYGKILEEENIGEFGEWIVIRQILPSKYYRMASHQLFTLQTSIYSTNNYASSMYKNGANRRDNPQNVPNYCGSFLYINGRRIVRISYLPFSSPSQAASQMFI